jgi:hypothetical protein
MMEDWLYGEESFAYGNVSCADVGPRIFDIM